jgi:DNA invertase Pin-like site-specific DNA recombinase
MPRRRKPHHHDILPQLFDPSVAFTDMLALYCRLSDDDPKAVSIEHQIQAGTIYAQQRGKTIVAIYVDWRTGFDPDRLALRALIEDAHAKKHSGVIFYDHYRFHRGVTGAYPIVMLHAQLPEYTYEATRDGYNIDQVGIWAGISGMEAETTRRRSMEQRRTRAEKGQWMAGMKPYWLERNPDTLEAVIVPERATAFLSAVQAYVEPTGSARETCRWLSEHAPLDPKRGALKQWTSQRFRKALRNPALWGDLPYARGLDVKDRVDGHFVIRKRVENPASVAFSVPALIHRNELERTQCRLGGGCERDQYPAGDTIDTLIQERDGKHGGRPYAIEHPLRHVNVLCACGWRVRWQVRRTGERSYLYVACAARFAKGRTTLSHEPCGMPHRPVNTAIRRGQGGGTPIRIGVWPRVKERLIEALHDPAGLAEQQRQQVLAEQDIEARSLAEEAALLDELDYTLGELDQRENRLYDRYDKKEISKNVYDTQTARIASERRDTEERKRQLLAQQLIVQRAEQAAQDLGRALEELGEIDVASFSDDEWASVLPDLVEAVVLDLDGEPSIRWHRPS